MSNAFAPCSGHLPLAFDTVVSFPKYGADKFF